ncbi:hypothetical protein BGZ63DRAFT_412815 [Mariannaea sp. PMI_226]|nr:hypothetical protein BGZ63DRAFT_412815 [Mariannaea sp. PMI_226]
MADTEEPQFSTLAEQQRGAHSQKAPPPPPGRPACESRSQSISAVSNVSESPPTQGSPLMPPRPNKKTTALPAPVQNPLVIQKDVSKTHQQNLAPPPLPSRATPNQAGLPSLPPRRASTQASNLMVRRSSASSELSQLSTVSALSIGHTASSVTSQGSDGTIYKLPPSYDPTSLPPLPPTKREREAKQAEEAIKEAEAANAAQAKIHAVVARPVPITPAVHQTEPASGTKPGLPPRLPSRPVKSQVNPALVAPEPALPPRKVPPRPGANAVSHSIKGFSSGKAQQPGHQPPPLPNARPALPSRPTSNDEPPPVPVASRPSLAQIKAASSQTDMSSRVVKCWVCHDWSGPDGVANQFPRHSLPRSDPVGHLARGLCDPFPSYTDKARAIFTWFHYNITYDTVSFFANNIKHMTVEDTIFSGKAVCQGYAETYKAIANRAGLECVLVSGHGKGYGYNALKPGERPPPAKPDGHAWNAVRIDGGEWRLLDACWGAGHLDTGTNEYVQKFAPEQFTRTNEKFGWSHFPKESKYQFRSDGRAMRWEEYYIGEFVGETPTFYDKVKAEGISPESVEPKDKNISVHNGGVVRFQFSKICEHWTSEKFGEGKPPLLLLSINGVDGRKAEMVPMETNGYWHWLDVNVRDLGAPGQAIQVAMLTSMDGRDARGATAQEYLSKKGKVGMSWGYVMRWELV